MPINPVIPQTVTVHLGVPSADAENVTVPFTDYIKNVASSEIYPTWPENAIRANIYAIITFTLNRIYNEWYKSQGYDFDITNTTQFDQAFVKDRTVFENVSRIVDEIFDSYVVRDGEVQPYFTSFCNGTTSSCAGLSQWGTVSLAQRGLSPLDILKNYYGEDINIVENAPQGENTQSYPGVPLKLYDRGNDVQIVENWLASITEYYPAIAFNETPDPVFDENTENAVKRFQEVFFLTPSGQVDKATWYKMKRIFVGVRRLSELDAIGITKEEATLPFKNQLQYGDSGEDVKVIQYLLNVLAYYNASLNTVAIDGIFGGETENAVKVFQGFYSLPVTGIVERQTYNKMTEIYSNVT